MIAHSFSVHRNRCVFHQLMLKRQWLWVCLVYVIGWLPLPAQSKTEIDVSKDKQAKMSYAFGMSIVRGWEIEQIDIDPAWVVQGAKDAIAGQTLLSEKDMVEILTKLGEELAARHRQKGALLGDGKTSCTEASLKLKSDRFGNAREQTGYALGMSAGPRLKFTAGVVDPEKFIQGLSDGLAGTARLTVGEMTAALAQLGQAVQSQLKLQREQWAEKNRKEGEAFLAKNKTHSGIVCLPSGLQYQIVAAGAGEKPELGKWVKLNYRGMRIDGTVFIESFKEHPEANIFGMGSITQGWSEALQLMSVGAKWRLYIPSDLAYGKAGSPGIGPNETLVYEIELVSVLAERPQPTAEDLKNEIGADGD